MGFPLCIRYPGIQGLFRLIDKRPRIRSALELANAGYEVHITARRKHLAEVPPETSETTQPQLADDYKSSAFH